MLPLVESMRILSRVSRPSASASCIMRSAGRSFTAAAGVRELELRVDLDVGRLAPRRGAGAASGVSPTASTTDARRRARTSERFERPRRTGRVAMPRARRASRASAARAPASTLATRDASRHQRGGRQRVDVDRARARTRARRRRPRGSAPRPRARARRRATARRAPRRCARWPGLADLGRAGPAASEARRHRSAPPAMAGTMRDLVAGLERRARARRGSGCPPRRRRCSRSGARPSSSRSRSRMPGWRFSRSSIDLADGARRGAAPRRRRR